MVLDAWQTAGLMKCRTMKLHICMLLTVAAINCRPMKCRRTLSCVSWALAQTFCLIMKHWLYAFMLFSADVVNIFYHWTR